MSVVGLVDPWWVVENEMKREGSFREGLQGKEMYIRK
jgi:hypothetical protein